MRYLREETVHAPPERVWRLMVDVESWPAWTQTMREIKRLQPGPLAVGSQSKVVQPKGPPLVWTVTELVPQRSFTWRAKRLGLDFEAVHRVDDAGSGARTTLEFAVTGPLAWLASLIAGKRIRDWVDTESAGLKRAAEQPD